MIIQGLKVEEWVRFWWGKDQRPHLENLQTQAADFLKRLGEKLNIGGDEEASGLLSLLPSNSEPFADWLRYSEARKGAQRAALYRYNWLQVKHLPPGGERLRGAARLNAMLASWLGTSGRPGRSVPASVPDGLGADRIPDPLSLLPPHCG